MVADLPPSPSSAPRSRQRSRRRGAALAVIALALTACSTGPGSPQDPASPTGPLPGVARNAPIHTVDPERIAEARESPATGPAASSTAQTTGATVTARSGHHGEFHPGAAGISLESTDLADPRLSEDTADLVSFLGSLHGPTLRFGGNSTDRRFFFTARDEPLPTDWPLNRGEKITRVTPEDLQRVAGLAAATDASVIVSANLARYDPERAGELARAAHEAFGERLAGIMVGNEPNGYYQGRDDDLTVKGPSWDTATYARQLTAYAKAIHRAVPGVRIVAPGAYSADWWDAAAHAPATAPLVLAVHQYPLSECGSRHDHQRPTIGNATDPATRENVDRLLTDASRDAREHELPLWITETSLSACPGSNPVTETLAAAVYQADYSLRAQRHGAERVAAHSALTPCAGGPPMSVLCSSGTLADPGEAFAPRANGLALALIDSIPAGTFRDASASTDSLTAHVIDHGASGATVVLSDFRDPRTAPARPTTVNLPFPVDGAVQAQLRGPAWQAQYPQASLFADHSASAGPTGSTPAGDANTDGAASSTAVEHDHPGDPNVALSVENALRPAGENAVSVDGYGLPITPVAQRPEVAGITAGSTSFTVPIPAGSTTVLTLKKTPATPTPQESS